MVWIFNGTFFGRCKLKRTGFEESHDLEFEWNLFERFKLKRTGVEKIMVRMLNGSFSKLLT